MIKNLLFIFIVLLTSTSAKAEDTIEFSQEKFMEKYVEALKNADKIEYAKLLLSESEMKELVQFNAEKFPNCITDAETNYTITNKIAHFEAFSKSFSTVQSYSVSYTRNMDGCGLTKGMKITITLTNASGTKNSRSLVLIRYNNTYKIVFDLANDI